MLFTNVILKNLFRRKSRSALTAAGLAVAVATSTALLSIAWGYGGSAADYYASRGVDLVVVRAGVTERMTSSLSAALASRLSALSEIAEVDGSLMEMVSLGEGSLIGIPLHGLDPGGFAIAKFKVESGRALRADDRRQALLGVGLAQWLGKQPGEIVDIEGTPFEVAGLFQSASALESNMAVVPLADVQELMDRPGQVSEFQIRVASTVTDDRAVRQLCRRIEALQDEHGALLGFKAQPTRQFVDTNTETRLAGAMAWGTSVIAIGLSMIGMLNTMLMSVLERTRELGILRALGWSRSRVVRMILGESLVINLIGVLIGTIAAWLLVRGLALWSVTRTVVQPELSPLAVLLGMAIALLAGIAGSFYPAYRGAGVLPTEALRYE